MILEHARTKTRIWNQEHNQSEATGPRGYKLMSCSTQLSIKFQLLINTKTLKKIDISCF